MRKERFDTEALEKSPRGLKGVRYFIQHLTAFDRAGTSHDLNLVAADL
jgi:hypothetical protein